jgi:hypothetical protein
VGDIKLLAERVHPAIAKAMAAAASTVWMKTEQVHVLDAERYDALAYAVFQQYPKALARQLGLYNCGEAAVVESYITFRTFLWFIEATKNPRAFLNEPTRLSDYFDSLGPSADASGPSFLMLATALELGEVNYDFDALVAGFRASAQSPLPDESRLRAEK